MCGKSNQAAPDPRELSDATAVIARGPVA